MKLLLPAAAAALLAAPLAAETITYDFTAQFYAGSNSAPDVSIVDQAAAFIGSGISGSITFDDTFVSAAGISATYGPVTVSINEFSVGSAATIASSTLFNDDGAGRDGLFATETPTGSTIIDRIALFFIDNSGTVFGDTSFPSILDLADFSRAEIAFISGNDSFADERIDFGLTSLELQQAPAVPLPAGLPLVLTGLAGFAVLRRKG